MTNGGGIAEADVARWMLYVAAPGAAFQEMEDLGVTVADQVGGRGWDSEALASVDWALSPLLPTAVTL